MKATEHSILGHLATAMKELPPVLQMATDGLYVPLKLGIDEELEALLEEKGIPDARKLVRRTLMQHTMTWSYRQAVAYENAMRHDLDGNPIERVSVEHQQIAGNQLLAAAMTKLARATKPLNQAAMETPNKPDRTGSNGSEQPQKAPAKAGQTLTLGDRRPVSKRW